MQKTTRYGRFTFVENSISNSPSPESQVSGKWWTLSNLNPITKFTSSSRSTEFKDILLWNISRMVKKTVPISARIVISYAMKRGIALWVWRKVNGNWDNNMIRISQWRESHCRQILASEERHKSKRAGLWESQPGIRIGKLPSE